MTVVNPIACNNGHRAFHVHAGQFGTLSTHALFNGTPQLTSLFQMIHNTESVHKAFYINQASSNGTDPNLNLATLTHSGPALTCTHLASSSSSMHCYHDQTIQHRIIIFFLPAILSSPSACPGQLATVNAGQHKPTKSRQ
jgi:hypothetical protein